jgi:hypothetical protein
VGSPSARTVSKDTPLRALRFRWVWKRGHRYGTIVCDLEPISDTTEPLTLAGRIAALRAGAYRLRWQVLGIDRGISQGEIPFTVK